jgi:hypothetical protein
MQLSMTSARYNLKILNDIVEGIPVNMVDKLSLLEFSSQMQFHDPAVLEDPSFCRADLDYDVFVPPIRGNSFCEQWDGAGMVHAALGNRHLPAGCIPVSPDIAAFFALSRIRVSRSFSAPSWCNRLATNAAWLGKGRLHSRYCKPNNYKLQGFSRNISGEGHDGH